MEGKKSKSSIKYVFVTLCTVGVNEGWKKLSSCETMLINTINASAYSACLRIYTKIALLWGIVSKNNEKALVLLFSMTLYGYEV